MSHTIFLLGAVIVTCFLPQKVFCHTYNRVTYLKKDVLNAGTDGLVITVDVRLETINEPIKGPHDEDDFNALCMPIMNNTIAMGSRKPDDVIFGGLGHGNTRIRPGFIFLTCFASQSTFGFHVVRRLYYIVGKVLIVYHNGGMVKTQKFQFLNNDGKLVTGAKITVETFSPYLQFNQNYVQFKGTYRSLDIQRDSDGVVGVRESLPD